MMRRNVFSVSSLGYVFLSLVIASTHQARAEVGLAIKGVQAFEAGLEIEATTGNFCEAPKRGDNKMAEGHSHANFYILNGFEGRSRSIPHIRITVVKNGDGAKVVFHATDSSADIRTLTGSIGPFLLFIRPCEDADPLWTQTLSLREVTAVSFDGVDIVNGSGGPDFRLRKKGNP